MEKYKYFYMMTYFFRLFFKLENILKIKYTLIASFINPA